MHAAAELSSGGCTEVARCFLCRLLHREQPACVLVPAMLNYGQLARLSKDYYPHLAEVSH